MLCVWWKVETYACVHVCVKSYGNGMNGSCVGDLTDDSVTGEDKPLDSIALAKFLSKAAKVTILLAVTPQFGGQLL